MAKKKLNKTDDLSRDTLSSQVEAFLNNGGEISQIPSGKSGVDFTKGNRNITITSSRTKSSS